MTSGGARNRSGPAFDVNSGRSDRRGVKLTALPRNGYEGEVPAYPFEDTDFAFNSKTVHRELEVWGSVWRTPQAAAWALEPWRWRTVAMYVRLSVRLEDPYSPATLAPQVIRLGDQIGLSPAGLKENGWALAPDELADKRESKPTPKAKPTRRLREEEKNVDPCPDHACRHRRPCRIRPARPPACPPPCPARCQPRAWASWRPQRSRQRRPARSGQRRRCPLWCRGSRPCTCPATHGPAARAP